MCREKEGEEETESALIASRQVCEGTDSHFRASEAKTSAREAILSEERI